MDYLVEVDNFIFWCVEWFIYDGILLWVLKGKIIVVMGLSGIGKIMLLCLIGG